MEVGSLAAVPLLAHGKLLGVLAFARLRTSTPFGPTDLHLAAELAERAASSIENARLYRAAQRAIEARDNVLGIVAHDLRNPLAAILMQAASLRRHSPPPERGSRSPVELIDHAARRMKRLIQDLLDAASIEAGRFSVQYNRLAPDQVIAAMVEELQPLVSSASLELRLAVAQGLPVVWGDRERLLQVFENLIGNAIKFTKPGGRITVGATSRNVEILFWVSDTGAGIDAKHVPHLFDRYWQGQKVERHSAGLGLTIVKGIVEAHGGRIWAESTLGYGSTFFFTIPVASRAPDARPTDDSTAQPMAASAGGSSE